MFRLSLAQRLVVLAEQEEEQQQQQAEAGLVAQPRPAVAVLLAPLPASTCSSSPSLEPQRPSRALLPALHDKHLRLHRRRSTPRT
jgi:hypothetical protein